MAPKTNLKKRPERTGKAARNAPSVRPLTGNEAIAQGAWEAGIKVADVDELVAKIKALGIA